MAIRLPSIPRPKINNEQAAYGINGGYGAGGIANSIDSAFSGGGRGNRPSKEQYRTVGSVLTKEYRNLLGDSSIDDITKQELLGIFSKYGADQNSTDQQLIGRLAYLTDNNKERKKIFADIKGSKAGTEPLFASRQYISTKLRLMRDQPGREQTLLTGKTSVQSALDVALGKVP